MKTPIKYRQMEQRENEPRWMCSTHNLMNSPHEREREPLNNMRPNQTKINQQLDLSFDFFPCPVFFLSLYPRARARAHDFFASLSFRISFCIQISSLSFQGVRIHHSRLGHFFKKINWEGNAAAADQVTVSIRYGCGFHISPTFCIWGKGGRRRRSNLTRYGYI